MLCPKHLEECVLRVAGPSSKNPGREFWSCPKEKNCFFLWADARHAATTGSPPSSSAPTTGAPAKRAAGGRTGGGGGLAVGGVFGEGCDARVQCVSLDMVRVAVQRARPVDEALRRAAPQAYWGERTGPGLGAGGPGRQAAVQVPPSETRP